MRSGALLGLIAWQVMLADSVPVMQQLYDEIPRSLSNIELLVPLVMSDASDASDESDPRAAGERYERARLDKDMPFSDIPSSEFVLDESQPSSSHKHKRGHRHSRKQELSSLPRSVYLETEESDESVEPDERSELGDLTRPVWRACSRLLRAPDTHQHELLLVLCSELLDEATAPAPPPACTCALCQLSEPERRARRELTTMGENSYWVLNYLRGPRKRKHRPDLGQE